MSSEERQVVQAKYAAPVFAKIPAIDIQYAAKTLLLKLHVITGWAIPQAELMDILIDQFSKKLIESYPNVNAYEMEYAFRNNSGVKDWGKAMNLNLIDEVMQPYLERRLEISRIEESLKTTRILLPPSETTDDEFIQAVYKLYKQNGSYKKIPVLAYKILEPVMNLSRADKDRIFQYIHETTSDGDIKELCKQKAVAEYFDML